MTPPTSTPFNGPSHRFSIRSTCWFIFGVKYRRSAICADSRVKRPPPIITKLLIRHRIRTFLQIRQAVIRIKTAFHPDDVVHDIVRCPSYCLAVGASSSLGNQPSLSQPVGQPAKVKLLSANEDSSCSPAPLSEMMAWLNEASLTSARSIGDNGQIRITFMFSVDS